MNNNKTALLLVDLQNDFIHPNGAYGRASQFSQDIAVLPQTVAPVAKAMRKLGNPIISTQFTLIPDEYGNPMIAEHLKKLRPFLTKGDFESGSWGNQIVDELGLPDYVIEKIAYSAFYMTRLEWVLKKINIKHLIVGGIVTNGGVASTVRNAHVLDFDTTILSDGCAAFSNKTHTNALSDLSTVSDVKTCLEVIEILS